MANEQKRRELRGEGDKAPRAARPAGDAGSQQRLAHARGETGDVSFPIAVRGYDRHAVDAYVKRVTRTIADLEAGSSPHAAVKDAVDRVGEQIGDVLQHARQAAEEITAQALAEAEATTAQARAEAEQAVEDAEQHAQQLRGRTRQQADEIVAQAREQATELVRQAEEQARTVQEEAEPRLRALEADTEAVWDARRRLLEDLPRMATELMDIAGAATARLRRPPGTSGASAERSRPDASAAQAGTGANPAEWPAESGHGRAPAHRS